MYLSSVYIIIIIIFIRLSSVKIINLWPSIDSSSYWIEWLIGDIVNNYRNLCCGF